MKLIINNSSMQPIYEQICTQIKNKILSGELKQEEMLPSVRTFLRCSGTGGLHRYSAWKRKLCIRSQSRASHGRKKKRSRNGSGTGDPQSKELRHDRSRDTGAV
mgnify:CR=1 FL=1